MKNILILFLMVIMIACGGKLDGKNDSPKDGIVRTDVEQVIGEIKNRLVEISDELVELATALNEASSQAEIDNLQNKLNAKKQELIDLNRKLEEVLSELPVPDKDDIDQKITSNNQKYAC